VTVAHLAALRDQDLVSVGIHHGAELIEPYHDRVRAAELAALPPDELRRGHKRMATALEARAGSALEDLAHHWEQAGRRSHAASYASRAADEAAARLQFHRAAELYAAAIELGEPLKASTRATLQIRLGNALGLAGQGAEAAAQLLAAAEVVEPDLAAALRRTAAEQLMASGDYVRGLDVLRAVLTEAGYPYPRGRLGMLTAFLGARARLLVRGVEPRDVAEPPTPAQARAIEAALAASRSLGMVDLIRGSYYQARCLRLALDTADHSHLAIGYALEACYVASSGVRREADARALVARAERAAEHGGAPERFATVQLAHAIIAFMSGRFDVALVAADRTAAIAAATPGGAWDLRTARIVACWCCWFSGQLRQLATRVRSYLREADASSDRYSRMQLRLGVNNGAWLVIDDTPGALRAVEDARATWPAEDILNLQYYGCIARVNALLYAGDDAAAAQTVATAWPPVERSLFLRVPFTHIAMREVRARSALGVAATTRDRKLRARSLAAARADADGIRRIAQPWCDASAALVDAGAAFVDGDRAAARRWLTAAAGDGRGLRLVARTAELALCGLDGTDDVVARSAFLAEGVAVPERLARLFCPPFFATLGG
jgi:tetratricopeptide (TPR) repeat protein